MVRSRAIARARGRRSQGDRRCDATERKGLQARMRTRAHTLTRHAVCCRWIGRPLERSVVASQWPSTELCGMQRLLDQTQLSSQAREEEFGALKTRLQVFAHTLRMLRSGSVRSCAKALLTVFAARQAELAAAQHQLALEVRRSSKLEADCSKLEERCRRACTCARARASLEPCRASWVVIRIVSRLTGTQLRTVVGPRSGRPINGGARAA